MRNLFPSISRMLAAMLLLAFVVVDNATADVSDPMALVDKTISQLRTEVSREYENIRRDPAIAMALLKDTVAPHVDMLLASRLVLGQHWEEATPDQRLRFVESLEQLLLRLFAIHIGEYHNAEVAFSPTVYKGTQQQRATVRTSVLRAGVPEVPVHYRMHRRDGTWKVYDVSILGISLVRTYHLTIDDDLEEYGIDGVIDRINSQTPLPARSAGSTS